jgi:hypothetical protein
MLPVSSVPSRSFFITYFFTEISFYLESQYQAANDCVLFVLRLVSCMSLADITREVKNVFVLTDAQSVCHMKRLVSWLMNSDDPSILSCLYVYILLTNPLNYIIHSHYSINIVLSEKQQNYFETHCALPRGHFIFCARMN